MRELWSVVMNVNITIYYYLQINAHYNYWPFKMSSKTGPVWEPWSVLKCFFFGWIFFFVKCSKKRKLHRWSSLSLRIIQFHRNLPKKVIFFYFYYLFQKCLFLFCFCCMYANVNHIWCGVFFFWSMFVASKNSVNSEDEENVVPKSTTRKVSAKTSPVDINDVSFLTASSVHLISELSFCYLPKGRPKKAPSTTKKARALSVSKQNGTIRK